MKRFNLDGTGMGMFEEPAGEWVHAEEALKFEAMLEDSLREERRLTGLARATAEAADKVVEAFARFVIAEWRVAGDEGCPWPLSEYLACTAGIPPIVDARARLIALAEIAGER